MDRVEAAQAASRVRRVEQPAQAAGREREDRLHPAEAPPRAEAVRAATPQPAVLPDRADRLRWAERTPQAGARALALAVALVAVAQRLAVVPVAGAPESTVVPVTVAPRSRAQDAARPMV